MSQENPSEHMHFWLALNNYSANCVLSSNLTSCDFFCSLAASLGLQRFAEQPKYTEVNPGQDALLVCKVIDKRGVCSWQKDNKPVGIYPKKYEWASQYGLGQTTHVGGDCSLWVRAAQLEFDDGLWECQVTASDFTTQDALTSQPVRLVVRGKLEAKHIPPSSMQNRLKWFVYLEFHLKRSHIRESHS